MITSGLVTRYDLFIQTKFTFRSGQDHRLPYDPKAPISTQVEQSFASSLEHLGTEVIDSYLLHGPSLRVGLAQADWQAWRHGSPPRRRPTTTANRYHMTRAGRRHSPIAPWPNRASFRLIHRIESTQIPSYRRRFHPHQRED